MSTITKVMWKQGDPCELPEQFNPFNIKVVGHSDYETIGSLKKPKKHHDELSLDIIEWIATEYLRFALSIANIDQSESSIGSYISTGNWIIRNLATEALDEDAFDNFEPICRVFQKIAAKTRREHIDRSTDAEQGNKTTIEHLHIVNRFLSELFPDDKKAISTYLYLGNKTTNTPEPPSEFCVTETVRFAATIVRQEESRMSEAIEALKSKPNLTITDITSFFNSSRRYRYSFLYLFIAVTGINATNSMLISLEDLSIDNDIKTSGKTMTTYKPRAQKIVSFELPKDFLIKYVKWYVNIFQSFNKICKKLELKISHEYIGQQAFAEDGRFRHITQYYLFRGWFKYNFRREAILHLKQRIIDEGIIDEEIKIPTPRDLRNYKATSIESLNGHNIAAVVMQHSTRTAFKYYQRRHKKEAIENLGEFYEDFYGFVKNIGQKIEKRLTSIPAGECVATTEEKSIVELKANSDAYISGDCTTPTGCLFCSFFVVHASQEGVFKLISMREYVLLKNKTLQWRSEFTNNYEPIITRINDILQELINKLQDKAIEWINKAEKDASYELHPDWLELYEMEYALLEVNK